MSSSEQSSYFFLNHQFEASADGLLSPGSDTSTLYEFVLDPSPSPFDLGKPLALVSPTETVTDHDEHSKHPWTSALSSRRLQYLERIEKVLSTELNPFDLLRNVPKYPFLEELKQRTRATGARLVDAVPAKGLADMQNPTLNKVPSHTGLKPDTAQHGAFYDPSSADGYSAPSQRSFPSASPALGQASPSSSPAPGMQLTAPNAFRDGSVNPSPMSSPNLSSASPANSHQRADSHSTEASTPPPFGQNLVSDPAISQTVGQIGQIKLDEDQRYAPTFEEGSDHVGSPAYQQSSASQSASTTYTSMAGNPFGGQTLGSTPQLTLGIPTVSVSSMDYTPIATTADANMPSINVMAPSPSTPKAAGANGGGGFQDILAQLAASQAASSSLIAAVNQPTNSDNWLPSNQATIMQNEPFSYADASGSTVESQQPNSNQDMFRPQSASGRLVPGGYSNESTEMMSNLAGNVQQRSSGAHAPGQWSSQAKRQDSYDKIRQFLRLDVDMGFQGNGKTESPTLANFRKRANSDIGPRSPVVAGNLNGGAPGGTAFDWSFAATNQAGNKADGNSFDLDWSAGFPNPSMQMDPSQLATMDPSLLNNAQLPIDMSQAFNDNNALLSSMQQQQMFLQQQQPQQHQQQQLEQQQQQFMPSSFPLNAQGNAVGGGVDFSQQLQAPGSTEFNPSWRFPGDGSQEAPTLGAPMQPKLRRSNSAQQALPGGHRRLAHSEDLSRSRMYQGADEDFLMQITAPNGGLAPPSAGRSVSSNNTAAGGHHHSMSGSARVHPYRSGHDRHYSFGSNASSSSASSASPLPQMGGGLMFDAAGNLVHYPSDATLSAMAGMGLEGGAHSPSASSVASATSSQLGLAQPPVPLVTSQATQAASASRRKSEALFACPIPGCGSTFTRQYNLRGHLRSHADERPYKCDWPGCDKSFARSHDCKRHQNLHLNIKPHTCEQCGKTFARLDALNRHHKSDAGGCLGRSDGESGGSNSNDGSSFEGSAHDQQSGSQQGSGSEHGGQVGMEGSNAGQAGKIFGGHVL